MIVKVKLVFSFLDCFTLFAMIVIARRSRSDPLESKMDCFGRFASLQCRLKEIDCFSHKDESRISNFVHNEYSSLYMKCKEKSLKSCFFLQKMAFILCKVGVKIEGEIVCLQKLHSTLMELFVCTCRKNFPHL